MTENNKIKLDMCSNCKNFYNAEEGFICKLHNKKVEEDSSACNFFNINTSQEIKEILENPNLFENLNKSLNPKIAGEDKVRKTVLLIGNGRNVENPNDPASYNLVVNASSGAGKDYVVSNTLDISPKDECIRRKRISKKVFTYWHNSKNEPNWTWDKKIFYCEDIPNNVLNEDVFKVMSSSGNAISTILINQIPIDVEIKGKPVIIVTTAEAEIRNENLRRFPIVKSDERTDQTEAVMKKQAKFAVNDVYTETDNNYIKTLSLLKRIKVRIPYAEELVDYFPKNHIIMRTNFPRFLDYIKSSCSLHQYQRQRDKDDYFLATKEDYKIAREILMYTTTNTIMIPLTKNQERILDVIRNIKDWISVSDLHPKCPFITDRRLKGNLDKLADFGFLKTDSQPVEYERNDREGNIIKTKGRNVQVYFFNEISAFNIPTRDEIMSNMSIKSNITNMSNMSETKDMDNIDKKDIQNSESKLDEMEERYKDVRQE